MNVSEATIKAVQELNTRCFAMNRLWDASISILKIDYVCENAASKIHPSIAHFYPTFADEINDRCLEQFNIKTFYGLTPAGEVSYNNLSDMMSVMCDETLKTQDMMMGAIDIALANKDYLVVTELYDLLKELNQQVAQIILLKDKAEQYGEDYKGFDKDIDVFFFLGKE